MNRFTALLSLVLAVGIIESACANALKVVVSVRPIHSLAASVMAGVSEPQLLLRGAQSPHSYSMAPSDARALAEADVIVWVGEALETFLVRSVETYGARARVIELMEADGVILLQGRSGGAWGEHEDHEAESHQAHEHEEDDHEHEHDHEHDHSGVDGHIWLDPDNAIAIVTNLARVFAELDPDHASAYAANAEEAMAAIKSLDEALTQQLEPVKDRPFVVFHDGYQYFEKHYGLNAVGAITVAPDRPPGARRLAELQQTIQNLGSVCIFAEPDFEPPILSTIGTATETRTGILDPLGVGNAPGRSQYFETMQIMAQAVADCLKDPET